MTGFEYVLLGLVKAAIGGAVAGAVIAIVCLNWDRIVGWFQSRLHLRLSDPNALGFSLQEKTASGQYRTVYGVFNKRTNQLLDSEKVTSGQVDTRVEEMHRGNEMVIFS